MAKDTFLHGQFTALERKAYYYFPIYYFLVTLLPCIPIIRWNSNILTGMDSSRFLVVLWWAILYLLISRQLMWNILENICFIFLLNHCLTLSNAILKNHKNICKSVFQIREILVQIRILGSEHLINGSGRPKNIRIRRIRNTGTFTSFFKEKDS